MPRLELASQHRSDALSSFGPFYVPPSRFPLPASRFPLSLPASSDHREMQSVLVRASDRLLVSRVGVTCDAGARVIRENALEADAHLRSSVGDDDLAGM